MIIEADEQEHFKNAMNTIHPRFRNIARKSYQKARSIGQTHAAAMTTMKNLFTEEMNMDQELNESEIVSHLTAKGNNGNVFHYVASKDGALITNKSGIVVHPITVLQKSKNNAAAEEVHKVISSHLQKGNTDSALKSLSKYSHFDWKSEMNESVELNEKTLTSTETSKKKKLDFVKQYGKDKAESAMYVTATKVAEETELNTGIVDESDSAIDGGTDGPIARASAKHGRIKPMSGTKTIATKIATILAKKV